MSRKFLLKKPRIKAPYFVLPQNNKSVQIGVTFGHAHLIEDDEGILNTLIGLMDGKRTSDQIFDILSVKFPHLKMSDIERALLKLEKCGLLEDNAPEPPRELNHIERERYKNQLAFFSMFANSGKTKYHFQQSLKNSTITLVGLGGGGSNILISLASMGIGKIIAVEFDRVELKNLNRQILYTENDVGELKTRVAAKRIKEINPFVKFEIMKLRVDSLSKARQITQNTDFVICTADGPIYKLYKIVNKACVEAKVPWISFGTVETTGIVGPLVVPGTTGCYECMINEKLQENPDYLKNIDYIMEREEELEAKYTYPSLIPIFSICSGLVVLEVVKHLTQFASPYLYNKVYVTDFAAMDTHFDSFNRISNCTVCELT
jgi:molybdopterin/thiamine biosynthesis adenylyltransferase